MSGQPSASRYTPSTWPLPSSPSTSRPRNDYPMPPTFIALPRVPSVSGVDAFARQQLLQSQSMSPSQTHPQLQSDITDSRTMPVPLPSPRLMTDRLPAFFGELPPIRRPSAGGGEYGRRLSGISQMSTENSRQDSSGDSRRGSDEIHSGGGGGGSMVVNQRRGERYPSSSSKYEDALEVQPQSLNAGSPGIDAPSPIESDYSGKSKSKHYLPPDSEHGRSSKRSKSDHSRSSSSQRTPIPKSPQMYLPAVLGSRNVTASNPQGYTHPMYIPNPAQASVIPPPELKHTPEELFQMLKGYKFGDTLASVGLRGPKSMTEAIKRAKMTDSNNKRDKVEIWTDDAEYAFLASELYLPPSVNAKVLFFQKPCGRNEIIGLIISMVIGKLMTRKQVSSHLQVVRQRKNLHPTVKAVFDREAREQDTGIAPDLTVPALNSLPKRLLEIIGVTPDTDLSQVPKPAWIGELESYHPGAEYKEGPVTKPKKAGSGTSNSKSPDAPPIRLISPPRSARVRQGVQAMPTNEIPLLRRDPPAEGVRRQSSTSMNGNRMEVDGEESSDSSSSEEDEEDERNKPSGSRSMSQSNVRGRRSSPARSSYGYQSGAYGMERSKSPQSTYMRPQLQITYVEIRLTSGTRLSSIFLERDTRPPYRDFASIPLADVRYPGIRDAARKFNCPILHIDLAIDLDLVAIDPREIIFDIGISGLHSQTTSTNLLMASSSGYLEGSSGRPNLLLISNLRASHEQSLSGAPPSMAYRPDQSFNENKLCSLLATQREAATTVLPYFWVLQEIFATGFPTASLVGSKVTDGRSCTPAAGVADDVAFIVMYSFSAQGRHEKPRIKVEQVHFT